MIKIAVANQKGGVGKTTTALNIADAMMHCDYRVLFVDLDPQCNSTSSYNAQIEYTETIYDLMQGKCSTKEAIQHTEIGDIIAGDGSLSEIESALDSKMGRYRLLKKALEEVKDDYDFCIIDTPPNLGLYMLNALVAADGCIIPIKAEKYAIDGLGLLINTVNDVIENENPRLKIYGVMLNEYDKRTTLGRETWNVLPEVGKEKGFRVFQTPVRTCQTIKDAQAEGVSLFERDPSCNAALDYVEVLKELLEVTKNG